jgi:hypothetical protein
MVMRGRASGRCGGRIGATRPIDAARRCPACCAARASGSRSRSGRHDPSLLSVETTGYPMVGTSPWVCVMRWRRGRPDTPADLESRAGLGDHPRDG